MGAQEKIKRLVGKAIFGYDLMTNGDKILLALSGGEDSLVLVHFLALWRKKVRIEAKIVAVHLDMGFPKDEGEYEEKVNLLRNFCGEREVEFFWEKTDFGLQAIKAFDEGKANPCFVCSWHRRKRLFKLAEELGANKIAFGHHKDDVITTFFLNLFFHGELSALVPAQEMFKGKLYLIRPLYFTEKYLISIFVSQMKWPVLQNPCPFSKETHRQTIQKLLENHIYPLNPKIKKSIFTAIFNPRIDYLPKPPKKRFAKD